MPAADMLRASVLCPRASHRLAISGVTAAIHGDFALPTKAARATEKQSVPGPPVKVVMKEKYTTGTRAEFARPEPRLSSCPPKSKTFRMPHCCAAAELLENGLRALITPMHLSHEL
jgi:hypothetical protein